MNKTNENNQVIDLSEILADYSGKWVVLSKDNKEVLKSGDNIDEILEFSDSGITMLVPEYDYVYSPYFLG